MCFPLFSHVSTQVPISAVMTYNTFSGSQKEALAALAAACSLSPYSFQLDLWGTVDVGALNLVSGVSIAVEKSIDVSCR